MTKEGLRPITPLVPPSSRSSAQDTARWLPPSSFWSVPIPVRAGISSRKEEGLLAWLSLWMCEFAPEVVTENFGGNWCCLHLLVSLYLRLLHVHTQDGAPGAAGSFDR